MKALAGARWVLDNLFAQLSGRLGWLYPAGLALATLCCVVVLLRSTSGPHGVVAICSLVVGFALVGALLTPWTLAEAVRGAREKSPGPFSADHVRLNLASQADGVASDIIVELWFPVDKARPAKNVPGVVQTTWCLDDLPIAATAASRRFILYMPHFKSRADDNDRLLAFLASNGYVIAALDDITHDPASPSDTRQDALVKNEEWRFQSAFAYAQTIALSNERVGRQASRALAALDRLAAGRRTRIADDPSADIDLDHVGFLGYSFGGSSAAEAAAMDRRIVAVANIDGSLFGRALSHGFAAPYLFLISDFVFPTRSQLASPDPETRYRAMLNDRDLAAHARLAARPGSRGVRVQRSIHENFRDDAYEPRLSKTWLFGDPVAISEIVGAQVRSFFDANLTRHGDAPLSDFKGGRGIQSFSDIGLTVLEQDRGIATSGGGEDTNVDVRQRQAR